MTKPKSESTIERWLAEIVPYHRKAVVCMDGDLLAEVERLGRDLVRRAGTTEAEPLAIELLAALERMEAAERSFGFRCMGSGNWRRLVAEHPPSDEHRAAGLDYDPATLPPAAMAACSMDPEMTEVEVVRLSEVLSLAQFSYLWDVCRSVNVGDWRASHEPMLQLAKQVVAKAERDKAAADD